MHTSPNFSSFGSSKSARNAADRVNIKDTWTAVLTHGQQLSHLFIADHRDQIFGVLYLLRSDIDLCMRHKSGLWRSRAISGTLGRCDGHIFRDDLLAKVLTGTDRLGGVGREVR